MNDSVKERDERISEQETRIAALVEENNNIKADYERLKGIIFKRTVDAIQDNYLLRHRDRYADAAIRMERWTTLHKLIEESDLTVEFHDYYKEWKGNR